MSKLFPAFLIGLLIASVSHGKDAYPPTGVEMRLQQVSDHVYYVQGQAGAATDNEGFISNAAAVVTDEGVVIFDVLGTPSLAARFLGLLREITDAPVRTVVVSHYHADHIYGLQVFKDLGAEIIAPSGANDYLQSPAAKTRLEERRLSLDPWVNDNTRIVVPDVFLRENTRFTLGGVEFIITLLGSAHSDGDLAMLVEPDRVLLSGDIIFEGRVPFVGDADTKRWLAVLESLETGGIVALVPGHGPAARDPQKAISLTRRYLAFLREHLGAAVEEMLPFAGAYDAIDWSEFSDLPAFEAANRRNAYQVFLSLEAESVKAQ
ncbi:MAG: MBL fold metallo-hydrolase [Chromatiales bacterium]|nr:MBL fold metallo-hydrolase [Chromatiales bacterium]